MVIYIKKIDGLVIPKTGSDFSAGYDIVATSEPIINGIKHDDIEGYWKSIDYIEYKTNVFIEPQENIHTYIFPRSSISKYNLALCNSVGLIDNDYRGEIGFRFKYIIQPQDLMFYGKKFGVKVDLEKVYKIGDRIGQMVASSTHRIEFKEVDELNVTSRGKGGFGSTGTSIHEDVKKVKEIIDTLPGSLAQDQIIRIENRNKTTEESLKARVEATKISEDNTQIEVSKLLKQWKEKNAAEPNPVGYEKLIKERENK